MAIVHNWMTWHDGINLTAITAPQLKSPNIIIHIGRQVNTPAGNAPSGLILFQPEPERMPAVAGFISTDKDVGKYFGPKIFAETVFEQIPVFKALITIQVLGAKAFSRCEVNGYVFELEMSGFSDPYLVHRSPTTLTPFWQQGIELSCTKSVLKVNGEVIDMIVPPIGITGGPASVMSPQGMYAR
jgi:hypothetical protein